MLSFALLSLATCSTAAPIFGLGSIFGGGAHSSNGGTTLVSFETVNSTLERPALFARAAYCPGASLESWECGVPCTDLQGVTFLQSGGDQGEIPFYFIAHDTQENSLVVAHEGTDPTNLLSLLNDAEFGLVDIDTQRIPQATAKGIQVHDGFQSTFQRTADGILAAVQSNLASLNVSKVLVTGHSLGAALAMMTGAMLRSNLPSNIDVVTTVFAPPRGGNTAYADFLDSTIKPTFVTNQHDPVPIVPPLLLGFQHPSGEIFIKDSTLQNLVSCPGQDDNQCITGNSLLDADISNHLGPYFNGITFGSDICTS